MRKDIAFSTTDGTTLRGWHFVPDGPGKYPTIIMAHGFSAVKEMYLDKYAEAFAQAGLLPSSMTIATLARATASRARKLIHGCKSETIQTQSPLPAAVSKPTRNAWGSGVQATVAAMFSSSLPSTGG
jgi:dienelactone hydrolase